MKMEILPIQNQFQGQFSVMGSSKIKDWTRPLTPPATNHHLKNVTPRTVGTSIKQTATTRSTTIINKNNNTTADNLEADIKRIDNKLAIAKNLAQNYANNNDLESSQTAATVITTVDESAVQSLAQRLQNELRRAKSQHLACTEVLLPSDLLNRIASKLIVMSEKEPCGIRGSIIYIEFEDEPNETRRIASLQLDPNTVSTFELYLTLKQDRSGWTSILPQFLKNLARSSTIMISPDFLVAKTKLYRSLSE